MGDTEGKCYWLSANKPYYKNGADGPTDVAEGANVAYDETTGVLTLDNYDGGPIRTNDGNGDLTIVAKGVNTIHAYQFGIFAPYCDLTITSKEQAQINMSAQTNNSGGIVTYWAFDNHKSITISGNVAINMTADSIKEFYGIRTDSTLSILDNLFCAYENL